MVISIERKNGLKKELVERLQMVPENSKIIFFRSFRVDDQASFDIVDMLER